MMRSYVTEFIGTFGLVFAIGCAVMGGSQDAPLAIGAVLMVLVYAGGHISGAHYNPAITLDVYLRGKFPLREVGPYWISQLAGACFAACSPGSGRRGRRFKSGRPAPPGSCR